MLLFLLRVLACLPLIFLHSIGASLGVLVWLLSGSYRRRLNSNAKLAGIHSVFQQVKTAMHTGMGLLELPYIWFGGKKVLKKVDCLDREVFYHASQSKRGIVFVTPHWGGFEVAARYYAQLAPVTVLFRPPRKKWLLPVLESSRQIHNLATAPANLQGVKQLYKALKRHEAVGMLPDQVPGQGEGVWADYFGQAAYTMVLPSRLAYQENALVISVGAERLSWGRGWRLHAELVTSPTPEDPASQALWMNGLMEKTIMRDPTQYLWGYNRYKTPQGVLKP